MGFDKLGCAAAGAKGREARSHSHRYRRESCGKLRILQVEGSRQAPHLLVVNSAQPGEEPIQYRR